MAAIPDGQRFVMGHDVHPRKSGKVTFNPPGPGTYLEQGGCSRTKIDNPKFGNTAGGALSTANCGNLGRGYWTKGQLTKQGLTYCPFGENNYEGPAQFHIGGCTMDGRTPAFCSLPEAHLRPRQTFGTARRFREVERLGMIKSGIHDLVLPGPGLYMPSCTPASRYTEKISMAPRDGLLHKNAEPAAKAQAFGSSATGISSNPAQRCDTPRGRQSWINGLNHGSRSGAGVVAITKDFATRQVISDGRSKINQQSSFRHSSFNAKYQVNSRNIVRSGNPSKAASRYEPCNDVQRCVSTVF